MNKEKEGAWGKKILPNFDSGCGWRKGFSFCDKQRFMYLHLCGCLVFHCFLEASSVYSSFIETKEVQKLIVKVCSINVCLLFCRFYYTYETCKQCALQQRKKLCISILILLLKLMRNILKYYFSGEEVLLDSIIGVHCGTADEGDTKIE